MAKIIVIFLAALSFCIDPSRAAADIPEYGYQVVRTYPHDRTAFTEGLFFSDGYLYEGTGMQAQSSIRKIRLETGEVLQEHDLPPQYFGEGIVRWKGKLVELTYKTHLGFVYDFNNFQLVGQFDYPGEGWGLTEDGKRIIMSDGTPQLRFLDPETLQEQGRLTVSDEGRPVENVNELEWVKGEIYANIWLTDRIIRIDPKTGDVVGRIDLSGLLDPADHIEGQTDVLNGIAYDPKTDRLFVTGKRWPKIYEIRLVKK